MLTLIPANKAIYGTQLVEISVMIGSHYRWLTGTGGVFQQPRDDMHYNQHHVGSLYRVQKDEEEIP